ncbi:MAG: FtsX-like permease family protein [Luteitalea sp.]|nr:FtsX-like permease family protein [Luteitalea sp.]
MNDLFPDFRHSLRQLRRRPGVAAAAIVTLALGIGATTAIFSVANASLLRPLPFPEPDRLVRIWETSPNVGDFSAAEANYLDFRARSPTFAEMAALSEVRNNLTLTGPRVPERLDSAAVTSSFFRVLGVDAISGRTFLPAEDRQGGRRVVVVSHAFRARRFAADENVVGRTLPLDGEAHEIVGVMPPGFSTPEVDVWVPLGPAPCTDTPCARDDRELAMIGRLRTGATIEQARADLDLVARQLGTEHPVSNRGWGVRLAPFSEWMIGPQFRQSIAILFGAVSLLLLMACANVANLLLARATTRDVEFAVRAALGAGHRRLTRQLLAESTLIGLLGAALGLAVALGALEMFAVVDPGIPRLAEATIDMKVLAFAFGAGLLTSLLFGLAPVAKIWRADVQRTLRRASRGSSGGGRLRETLTVAQVALALMLLISAGLLLSSFLRLRSVDLGFDAEHVLAVPLTLQDGEQHATFLREITSRLERLPGVRAAGATTTNPLRQWGFSNDVTPEERAASVPPSGFMQAGWRSVTPGFFDAMGIPLRRGRVFTADDRAGGMPVVVISETLAQSMWPKADAVGKRLFWGGVSGSPRLVVGVVGDIRDVQLDADPPPVMFLPYDQVPVPGMTLVVRTAGRPGAIAASVRETIWDVDGTLPVPEVQSIGQNRAAAMAGPRFNTLLLGVFAAAALMLAAVGIYAVMAFAVARRTREIGIRVALGATPRNIRNLVLGRGAALAACGIALGAVGAWGATRFLGGLLYDTAPTEAWTFLAASLLLGSAALAASYLPARRALGVDPTVAMREE